jgi:hypothetical protein
MGSWSGTATSTTLSASPAFTLMNVADAALAFPLAFRILSLGAEGFVAPSQPIQHRVLRLNWISKEIEVRDGDSSYRVSYGCVSPGVAIESQDAVLELRCTNPFGRPATADLSNLCQDTRPQISQMDADNRRGRSGSKPESEFPSLSICVNLRTDWQNPTLRGDASTDFTDGHR